MSNNPTKELFYKTSESYWFNEKPNVTEQDALTFQQKKSFIETPKHPIL